MFDRKLLIKRVPPQAEKVLNLYLTQAGDHAKKGAELNLLMDASI